MAASHSPLDSLRPEARATLSLLLIQGRSYAEISEMLHLDVERVRDRAHEAMAALVPAGVLAPAPDVQARIADYLLGELPVSERVRARTELTGSAAAHAWAGAAAAEIGPLAEHALPVIPEMADAQPEPSTEPPPPRQRRSPWIYALIGVLVIALAVVAVLVATSGSSSPPRRTSTRAGGGTTTPSARTIRRVILTPTGTASKASATGAIVRERGGLLLLLRGKRVPPNHHGAYGVWLMNRPTDARLLGFISPAVGAAGTFSSGTSLPDDAVRFGRLVITRETSSRPSTPGPVILQTPLSLP
jgi:hypothetical protein